MVARHSHITKYIVALFFICVLAYAYFEAGNFLHGPKINLGGNDVLTTSTELVVLSGTVQNVIELLLDGLPIALDENGAFEERRLLAPGNNVLILEARDAYNRTTKKTLHIMYTPLPPAVAPIATSTQEAN